MAWSGFADIILAISFVKVESGGLRDQASFGGFPGSSSVWGRSILSPPRFFDIVHPFSYVGLALFSGVIL